MSASFGQLYEGSATGILKRMACSRVTLSRSKGGSFMPRSSSSSDGDRGPRRPSSSRSLPRPGNRARLSPARPERGIRHAPSTARPRRTLPRRNRLRPKPRRRPGELSRRESKPTGEWPASVPSARVNAAHRHLPRHEDQDDQQCKRKRLRHFGTSLVIRPPRWEGSPIRGRWRVEVRVGSAHAMR